MIIEVRGLTKEFKIFKRREGVMGAVKDLFNRNYTTLRAVDNIDFSVNQGEIVGYIGANGAGKSTTIKMLSGILVPTAGTITVAGFVPYRDRTKFTRNIGVVFGQRSQLWWDLAVIESLGLLGKIYQIPKTKINERIREFDDLLNLGDLLHKPVRKLSLGQRMRCELAAAFIHSPSIVFLDEPTIGLDVLAKSKIREFLQAINKQMKTTILLTTHDLGDIEALCHKISIIDHGKIVFDGQLRTLQEHYHEQSIEDIVKHIYADGYKESF